MHKEALVTGGAGNDPSLDARRLGGKPVDVGGCVGDLPACFRQRLALLGGEERSQILGVGRDEFKPAAQDGGAPARRLFLPKFHCPPRRRDGLIDLGR